MDKGMRWAMDSMVLVGEWCCVPTQTEDDDVVGCHAGCWGLQYVIDTFGGWDLSVKIRRSLMSVDDGM